MMKLSLQNSVLSRQDLKAIVLEISNFGKWFSQSAIKKKVAGADAGQQPVLSPAAADLIKQWHGDKPITTQTLDELIKALEDFAAKAPHATVTLAALAPAKLKQEIVAWFRKNVQPNILVDFSFNSTMLGGMMVRYGSHVYDWSFKRQILAARGKFPETLRNV